MADEIDRAQQYDEMYRTQALNTHFDRRRKRTGLHRDLAGGTGSAECTDCGEPINPSRILAMPHAIRCVECQERHERLHGKVS
jgi:DnaK suppressor protein